MSADHFAASRSAVRPGLRPGFRWALFLSLVGLAPAASAYLDPSTGSMILSAIVGIFATLGLAIKTYWYKLKNLLKGSRANGTEAGPGADPGAGKQPADRHQEPGSDPG